MNNNRQFLKFCLQGLPKTNPQFFIKTFTRTSRTKIMSFFFKYFYKDVSCNNRGILIFLGDIPKYKTYL